LIQGVDASHFRLLSPLQNLILYQWHTRTAKDYFCPICGVLPFRRPRRRTTQEIAEGVPEFCGWGINVRCLEGIDLDAIPVKMSMGAN
jgi:hypothetical protein